MGVIYDVIGDIHGHADTLVELLRRLGYVERARTFLHPWERRKAIFLGDFIDRGPQIRRTLSLVRRMLESGAACSVMGNHEYNAICFHTRKSEGVSHWLRPRVDKNIYQHIDTLYQFRNHRSELLDYVQWFFTLPLYLDLGVIRAVHASWRAEANEVCGRYSPQGNLLTSDFLFRSVRHGSEEFRAVETILKGVEIDLPEDRNYLDKDGNPRNRTRVAWWVDARGKTFGELQFPPGRRGADDTVVPVEAAAVVPGYPDEVPIFIGHYWLTMRRPV